MAGSVFDLFGRLVLDTKEYEKGVENAKKGANGIKTALSGAGQSSETLKNKIAVLTSQYDSANKRVEELTKSFNESVQKTGAASKESQELAEQLNNAEKEANDLKKELDGLSPKAEEAGKKFDGLGEKLKAFGATAGKIVGTIAKVGAAAVGAASTAVVALSKQAIDSYADYEQLVGGVETLFGAGGRSLLQYAVQAGKTVDEVRGEYNSLMVAQNLVMRNAANAYKTAGLSANEYMETVTGMSASLIQSLGGDTRKAANYADMAIQDMSDNANKMGTSMESIQAAYQGFAKQNYTMLDNLNTMGALAA